MLEYNNDSFIIISILERLLPKEYVYDEKL